MFKLKKELVKDKAIVEIEEVSKHCLKKLDFAFDKLCELENAKVDAHNQELIITELKEELKSVKRELANEKEYNQKLYDYTYKLATIIQSEKEKSSETNQKLLDEIADLKSDRYAVKKVNSGRTPSKQKVGVKRSATTSKIIKKVKEN